MTGAALADRWGRLIALANSVDGIIMLVGFLGIIAGLVLESIAGRLVCFLVAALSGVLTLESIRAKRAALRQGLRFPSSLGLSQEEGSDMK